MKRLLLVLAAAVSLVCHAGEPRWAVVDVSSCFLRAKPDYESPLESQCLMGTVVEVTGSERYWRQVNAPDYAGVWTNDLCLAYMTAEQKDAYIAAPKYICTATYSSIYSLPSKFSQPLCDLVMGDLVLKSSDRKEGWLHVHTASGKEGWMPADDAVDFAQWSRARKPDAEHICATAMRFLGVPYMWGGNTVKHFDCSGFTKFVFMMNGIVLPRNASQQIRTGEAVPYDLDRMKAGDLVFFGNPAKGSVTHVALYLGDGKIIHSSMLVRMNSLRKGDPDFYTNTVVGVRRILGHVDDGTGAGSVEAAPWYFKK